MPAHNPAELPNDLPVPFDDGACDHLGREPFRNFPAALELPCTDGSLLNLSALTATPTVLFFYPRTGVPGQPPNLGFNGEDWDSVPGARGCTPQACGFRDAHAEFARRGVNVLGISTNTTDHQREFRARTQTPIHFLSDSALLLTSELHLPTFKFPVESGGPTTLLRRMALYCDRSRIIKAFYPVFPPDQNAARVLHWLDHRADTRASQPDDFTIRAIEPRDLTFIREELTRNFHAVQISSRGRWFDADQLPGFIAARRDGLDRVGLLTHTALTPGETCEVVTLSSRLENSGVGSLLLAAAVDAARSARCSRIFLTTTNDNLRALGFYQRRGWTLAALHPRQMDIARQTKPEIPLMGANGIPLRDELELELVFSRS